MTAQHRTLQLIGNHYAVDKSPREPGGRPSFQLFSRLHLFFQPAHRKDFKRCPAPDMSGEGRETAAAAAAGRGGSGGGEVMKKKEKAKKGSPPDEMEALIPISPGTLPSSRSMSPRPPPRPPSSTTTGPQHPQNGSSALDPIQRQKIRQLRLQAAKAARSKERGCQSIRSLFLPSTPPAVVVPPKFFHNLWGRALAGHQSSINDHQKSN